MKRLCALVVVVLAVPTSQGGDRQDAEGGREAETKIAFLSVRDDKWDISVTNADGCGQIDLRNDADQERALLATGTVVPNALFFQEFFSRGEEGASLICDDVLLDLPTGQFCNIGFIPDYARIDLASNRIVAGAESKVAILQASPPRLIKTVDALNAWFDSGNIHLTIRAEGEIIGEIIENSQYVVHKVDDDGYLTLCTDDTASVAMGLRTIRLYEYDLCIKDRRASNPQWIYLARVGDKAVGAIGSKLLLDKRGRVWFLAGSPSSGRTLAHLSQILTYRMVNATPEVLNEYGASIFCTEIWLSGDTVSAVYYRFTFDEIREWFLFQDVDKDEALKIKDDVDALWPHGEKWAYLLKINGKLVYMVGDLKDVIDYSYDIG